VGIGADSSDFVMAADENKSTIKLFDSVLYVANNYVTGTVENFETKLGDYNFGKAVILSALKNLVGELVKIDSHVGLTITSSEFSHKKTIVKELHAMLLKIPFGASWEFYPEFKERFYFQGPKIRAVPCRSLPF